MGLRRWQSIGVAWFLGLVLWLGGLAIAPAGHAELRLAQEAPDHLLYKSWNTLRDREGRSWQVVLFRRGEPMPAELGLRLVGFPGAVAIAHPQPLEIESTTGAVLRSPDLFQQDAPAPSVGQYDLLPLLDQLPSERFQLRVPLTDGTALEIRVPQAVAAEWRAIAQLQGPSPELFAVDEIDYARSLSR